MKCSKCGNEVKDGAKFCNICGEKLNCENNQPNR
ncbi:MAG: zinc-ribbon domain-containing protein [Intestinibacter sp.]|nr:zinc-ribbon domain-containing protein [Intestinibacter sp.]MDY4574887.1 zinc-ribbon domain-containing protein [Intestinibacter sp.]